MPHLNIIIKTLKDTEPAFKNLEERNYKGEAELTDACILEGGMASGRSSVALLIKLPDGKYTIAQTSSAIIDMLYHAIQGAEHRFLDEKIANAHNR